MKFAYRLALIALQVLALGQSCRATETNHNFARWEKEITAFERSDATNPPPKGALLFIGSSTIRGWKTLAQDFPEHRVINRGFGGSEIVDSTHFADRILFPYAPKAIFFRAGGNDLAAGKSVEQVFVDFTNFVTTVQAKLPDTDIAYLSWTPTVLRWSQHEKEKRLNSMIQEFIGEKSHLKYIECYNLSLGANGQPRPELFLSDKLHFNAEGYKLLATAIRPHLPKLTQPVVTAPK